MQINWSRLLACLTLALSVACAGLAMHPALAQQTQTKYIEVEGADEEDAKPAKGEKEAGDPAAPVPDAPGKKLPGPPADPFLDILDPRTYRLKIIHKIEAVDGPCDNVMVIGPIPMDWPEQKVKLLSEKMTEEGKATEQVFRGQAAMLKFQIGAIPKGGSAYIERLYEITRYRTQFKMPPSELKYAKRAPSELRDQLAGPAPGMETKHPKMQELHQELSKEELAAWNQVKNYWSWTRDNVKFQNGDYRGALFAIENKCGDCEEMSALFVGLCRLSNIPARTVWVEGHDYPEFYLTDKKGAGHWIPAQVVGPPWFGEIIEYRPIFQKGDRFYDPFQKTYVRYVPHTVKAGGSAPKLTVKHDIIADSDINGPSYNNPK